MAVTVTFGEIPRLVRDHWVVYYGRYLKDKCEPVDNWYEADSVHKQYFESEFEAHTFAAAWNGVYRGADNCLRAPLAKPPGWKPLKW